MNIGMRKKRGEEEKIDGRNRWEEKEQERKEIELEGYWEERGIDQKGKEDRGRRGQKRRVQYKIK